MIKATHYVIDLETLGTRETAVIASIGAIRIRDLQIDGEAYYRVDMAAAVGVGRTLANSARELAERVAPSMERAA